MIEKTVCFNENGKTTRVIYEYKDASKPEDLEKMLETIVMGYLRSTNKID